MEHIDFHVSYRCVNNCIFCSSAVSMEEFKDHPLEYKRIICLLKEKSGKFKSINFTGGEPTILPFFPRLLSQTKKLGYEIYVGTNGAAFADKGFCRRTVPFIDKVCFSFHGHNKKLHGYHTANENSFAKVNKAAKNLSEFPVFLMSNTVITRHNLDHLEEILSLLASNKIKQALLSNVAPEGRGLKNYKELAARLKDIGKKAPGLVKLADHNRMVLRFFGIPACILGDYAAHSNDFFWDPRLNIELARKNGHIYLKEEEGFLPTRNRVKTRKCGACLYKDICGGVFEEYYRLFGDAELRPSPLPDRYE